MSMAGYRQRCIDLAERDVITRADLFELDRVAREAWQTDRELWLFMLEVRGCWLPHATPGRQHTPYIVGS
jgi:hypothetical protein